MAHHTPHGAPPSDMKAAFTGLIGGAIALLIMVYVVVLLTNRKFESHAAPAAGTPAAATTGH